MLTDNSVSVVTEDTEQAFLFSFFLEISLKYIDFLVQGFESSLCAAMVHRLTTFSEVTLEHFLF